jgi:hypothetical protein
VAPELIVLLVVMFAAVGVVALVAGRRGGSDPVPYDPGAGNDLIVADEVAPQVATYIVPSGDEGFGEISVRQLSRASEHKFAEEWASIQALFVEDPEKAVDQADGLIGDVLRARGYPVAELELLARDPSVELPSVVEQYGIAHALATEQQRRDDRNAGDVGDASLHQAFALYRALFAELLEASRPTRDDRTLARPSRVS